jgi:hypothetical protein
MCLDDNSINKKEQKSTAECGIKVPDMRFAINSRSICILTQKTTSKWVPLSHEK